MKKEYDFTNAEQGKFYRPIEEIDIPIYLDKEIKEFFLKKIRNKDNNFSLNKIINFMIKQDIEISKNLLKQTGHPSNCKPDNEDCQKVSIVSK
jgi:hypothetical protein